jgi:hypothetical protein
VETTQRFTLRKPIHLLAEPAEKRGQLVKQSQSSPQKPLNKESIMSTLRCSLCNSDLYVSETTGICAPCAQIQYLKKQKFLADLKEVSAMLAEAIKNNGGDNGHQPIKSDEKEKDKNG